ncbi:MAG: hypothetical protein KJN71_08130 [Acidimicrobiia bacterium]|nr:hypothetical protein [Acidimicrobiia bacterium]
MSRKPNQPPPPDQTGEWFLNVVTPTSEIPVPGELAAPYEPTPAHPTDSGPADLYDPVDDTFTDWEPTTMSKVYRSRRTWRWSIIFSALFIAAIVGTAMLWAPRYAEDQVEERRTEFGELALALQGTLPAAADAIGPVTGPDSTEALTAINAIAGLQDAATNLDRLATEDHPSGLPFIGPDPGDELEPIRARAARLAPLADSLGRRLTEAVTYRTIADDAFLLPDLPVEADSAATSALSVSLATTLADTVGVAAALPTDPAFEPHRAYLDAATTRYEQWQAEYLDALRRDDALNAGVLADEMDAILIGLDDALTESLEGLRVALLQHVQDLDRESVEVQILAAG